MEGVGKVGIIFTDEGIRPSKLSSGGLSLKGEIGPKGRKWKRAARLGQVNCIQPGSDGSECGKRDVFAVVEDFIASSKKTKNDSSTIPSILSVCNHFLLGFPHYWEEYADQCCGQESVGKGVPTRISSFFEDVMSSGNCSSTFPPFSLDEIPVTRVCDFIMSPQRDVENGCLAQKLFDDVVEKCGFNVVQDESACKQKKNGGQFKMDTKVFTPSTIVTRSMSRLKNNVMEQEESLSLKPSIGDEKTSTGRGKQSEGVGSESGSKECHQTTFAQEDKQVMGNLDKSTLRRSSRHMNQKKETHPHL
ncbi:hypothetical protein LWI29_033522 [Acer saccharum]|uniref:SANTA domain-containing protein n=1 Tax=Acer saccharum TaxID=4024 RepID=A0AA39RFK5_ACESA|nr:hypothetical protein LWI29_033522 [Acer saccharum]